MRYVPTLCLREGMVLAKNLYGNDGSLLLQQGQPLKPSYISHIAHNGFQGVYISDKLSDEIEIKTVINDQLRNSAVTAVKDMYNQTLTTGFNQIMADNAKVIVQDIVEEIILNQNIMVNMIDLKSYDNYTYFHSVNVGVLSIVMGVTLGLNETDLFKLGLGALLHDIGKVFVSKGIIDKTDSLTPEEYEEVKKHPDLGYEYLTRANLDLPLLGLIGILQHHERMDGSGYPAGLSGDGINRFSRIISIADVFDAMTSDRPYRPAMMPSEVMEYLMGGAGTLFDPELIQLFTRKVAAFPLGTCVLLNNGLTAIVVENYEDCVLRPKVKVVCSNENKPMYLDLKNNRNLANLTITGVVKI
ncbi:HD-GYP domain-containing protein [Caproiciproducens faecalis]|uniref:HD-GYP domain-containing protein n=1 Tax=Caproiciproducens faecalis TaxID=2820301 RepID=A0ABS7DLC6_9FIRM|nr:HD-GYP domain-containing protein [Caproiciproducens faecalis]MBW7572082.1 HD-GYP domain-containing protein [Caproiciproducens faecalis]